MKVRKRRSGWVVVDSTVAPRYHSFRLATNELEAKF